MIQCLCLTCRRPEPVTSLQQSAFFFSFTADTEQDKMVPSSRPISPIQAFSLGVHWDNYFNRASYFIHSGLHGLRYISCHLYNSRRPGVKLLISSFVLIFLLSLSNLCQINFCLFEAYNIFFFSIFSVFATVFCSLFTYK